MGKREKGSGRGGYSVTAASLGPRGARESRGTQPPLFSKYAWPIPFASPLSQGRVTTPSFGPHAPTVATTRTFFPFSTPSRERGIAVSRTPLLFPASGL